MSTLSGAHDDVQGGVREQLLLAADTEDMMLSPHHNGPIDKVVAEPTTGGRSSVLNLCWNYINCIVGSGIVGLPYVFVQSGFAVGLGLLAVLCGMSTYSVILMVGVGARVGKTNYEDLCRHAFGWWGYMVVSIAMFMYDFGAMLTYLIILGDTSSRVAFELAGIDPEDHSPHTDDLRLMYRRLCIGCGSVVFILPWCLFRDVSKLERLSFVSVITLFAIIIIVFVKAFDPTLAPEVKTQSIPLVAPQIFPAIGTVSFSFVCNDSAFLLYNTMRRPTHWKWMKASFMSVIGALVVSCIFAVPGYLTFRNETLTNVLNNYANDDPVMIGVRIAYVLTMAFTYPISVSWLFSNGGSGRRAGGHSTAVACCGGFASSNTL